MILTKEHVEQIRRIMVDGDAAFDEEQALFDALDTITALRSERDALRRELDFVLAEWLKVAKIADQFCAALSTPASGEPVRKP